MSTFLKSFGVALVLGTATSAIAAPPPGSRWSDAVGANGRTGGVTYAPRAYAAPAAPAAYPTPVTYAVPAAAAGTIAVRGPDGVVRHFAAAPAGVQVGTGVTGLTNVIERTPAPAAADTPAAPAAAPTATLPCR